MDIFIHVPEVALPESLFPTTNPDGQLDFRFPTAGIFLSSLPQATLEQQGLGLGTFMAEHEQLFYTRRIQFEKWNIRFDETSYQMIIELAEMFILANES